MKKQEPPPSREKKYGSKPASESGRVLEVTPEFIPEKGDIILLDFTPQSGKEQAGKRPALVLSPREYNEKVGLMVACPITSQVKGYPFEVSLPKKLKTQGVILSDHVKSLDWKSRNARFLEKLPQEHLREVVEKLELLLL